MVTIERQQEVVWALSNGDISNYLDGSLTRFQGHGSFEVEYRKNLKIKLLLPTLTYGMVLYLVTLSDLLTRPAGLSASAELLV